MKKNLRFWAVSLVTAASLAACGGGGDGDQTPKVKYSSLVSFGDSLSDVGSYAVSAIVAPTIGGGKYTVNGANGKIWTELLAAQLGLSAPCAAQTGLKSVIPGIPAVPVVNKAGCFSYGQGGSRVTNAVGVANLNTYPADPNGALGQLTDPVLSQINRHLLAVGGSFKGDELVSVLAGANDVFVNLGGVSAKVAAASSAPGATAASVAAAAQAASSEAVIAMGVAGGELAAYVKGLMVAKGAKYVVVVNLPNVSKTPLAYSLDAPTQGLVQLMTTTFNAQLAEGLKGSETEVAVVDAFTQSNDQATNPAQYSLTNTTTPACDFKKTIFASSLVCSDNTLVTGDVSKYLFADAVHPTPYGYQLLAQFVSRSLTARGWL